MNSFTNNSNSLKRFSNRVDNYVKYRPTYPVEIIDYLKSVIGFTSNKIIADIGSGTGISAKMFLDNNNTVFGVEPNKEMREAAEKMLKTYSKFRSIEGTAEHTNLLTGTIDLIIAAQAFHWFDIDKCRMEFKRILKPTGYVLLIWNDRNTDTTQFLKEYENLLQDFATDYKKVNHKNISDEKLKIFFGHDKYLRKVFKNEQVFDLEGLKGRLLSSSYVPEKGANNYDPMMSSLETIFERNKENGVVKFEYNTTLFLGKLT